jgi:hypothetical protein
MIFGIKQEDFRTRHKGAGNGDTLLLPTGKFTWPTFSIGGEADTLQCIGDAADPLRYGQMV